MYASVYDTTQTWEPSWVPQVCTKVGIPPEISAQWAWDAVYRGLLYESDELIPFSSPAA